MRELAGVRVLYLGYGRAGHLCLRKLCDELKVETPNILCYTYDLEENNELLEALKSRRIEHHTSPLRNKEAYARIETFKPDVTASIHFRDRVTIEILNLASIGSFNLHPSLLPKYRGTFSAPWVIINGEKETGITYHYMNERFDDGRIILQRAIPIENADTGYSLFHKLIDLGVQHFTEVFTAVVVHRVPGYPQQGESSYYPRKVPFGGIIDRTWADDKIERFIRALTFPGKPGPLLEVDGRLVEVRSIEHYRELCS